MNTEITMTPEQLTELAESVNRRRNDGSVSLVHTPEAHVQLVADCERLAAAGYSVVEPDGYTIAEPEPENGATYCPEDDKLRLYVGRVPRPEYDALRSEGWTATPKQDCQFVAHWTPKRRDTALAYGEGYIGDEDQSPADRAADRAERFAGYREKRTDEATGHADRYDAGPSAHGFQSQARADRAAARHDRIADRAGDAWSKAEYWQMRTAGVISHALHVCGADVRMGRIKILEADIRRMEQNPDSYPNWLPHARLRLAYEEQMIEAQGGRAGVVEMKVGGTWRGATIAKVNKSSVTGRVVSVAIIGPKLDGWTYQAANVAGTPFALYQFETERAKPESYGAPTDASRAKLAEFEAAKKAAAAVRKATVPACPLINPTDADAERLQALWNAQIIAKGERSRAASRYNYCPELEGEQSKVLRCTQAGYSAHSGGTYAHAETTEIEEGGNARTGYRGKYKGVVCCKVRTAGGDTYKARRVIVITDKPKKSLPASLWVAPVAVESVNVEAVTA